MDGGLEKHANCNPKKQGSWEEEANHRGGMESRKAIPGEGNSISKLPEAEGSGKHWRLGGAGVQQRPEHTALVGVKVRILNLTLRYLNSIEVL